MQDVPNHFMLELSDEPADHFFRLRLCGFCPVLLTQVPQAADFALFGDIPFCLYCRVTFLTHLFNFGGIPTSFLQPSPGQRLRWRARKGSQP